MTSLFSERAVEVAAREIDPGAWETRGALAGYITWEQEAAREKARRALGAAAKVVMEEANGLVNHLRDDASLLEAWELFEPGQEPPAPMSYKDLAVDLRRAALALALAGREWRTFNINERVRVRLTDEGRKIMRRNHDAMYEDIVCRGGEYRVLRPIPEDADGWSEWQLWSLMSEFGADMYNGCSVPFETKIQIAFPAPPAAKDKP